MSRQSSGRRARRTRNQTEPERVSTLARLMVLVAAGAWVFVLASLASYDPADAPSHAVWPPNDPTANWCGPAGAAVAHWGYRVFGWSAWTLLFAAGGLILVAASGRRVDHPAVRVVGIVFAASGLAGLQAHLLGNTGPLPGLPGGTVGLTIGTELGSRFGRLGTGLALALAAALGLVVALDRWLLLAPAFVATRSAWVREHTGALGAFLVRVVGAASSRASSLRRPRAMLDDLEDAPVEIKPTRRRRPAEVVEVDDVQDALDEALDEAELQDEEDEGVTIDEDEDIDEYDDDAYEDDEDDDEEPIAEDEEDDNDFPGAPQVFSDESIRDKVARLPLRFSATNKSSATAEDLSDFQNIDDLESYRFPGLDLLEEPDEGFNLTLEELVREQAEALEGALRQYKIDGEVVGIESGPVITLYDVKLAPGTKVSKLTAVSSDLARALKAVNIRIVPNQVGRDTIGVEVPNPTKEKVRLKELMSSRDRFAKMKLPMFLGKDASGEPLIEDLTKMPHMLIAGTTGSGKSVCMNTIIMSFLYTKKPNELKLVLVDPKMVEMSQFKDIPHLMCPVVTEMAKASAILEWAVKKMDERYELLAEAGCRDIASYNELEFEEICERLGAQGDEEKARVPRRLPYMVFIIDELADLMMTNKEVEGSIIRIAQKARAVGIHLILATQRPQANVVTGLIKSNMPCRIAFKVASGMDSRIVLDQKGGELLLGQGDMLYLSPRSHKLHRAQGTLVDDHEIRKVVKFMREVAGPTYERQLMQLRTGDGDEQRLAESENNSSASLAAAQEDPLFDRAVEIVLETKRGSVSLLQRRLAIGYTRASRLIDLMGIAGIIGEHKGSVAREVAITIEEWEAMKAYHERLLREQEGDRRSDDEFAADQERAKANYKAAQGGIHRPAADLPKDINDGAEDGAEEPPFDTDDETEIHDEADEDEDVEYVLVDEDGNEIDPEDAEEYELVDEDEDEDDAEDEADDEEEAPSEPRRRSSSRRAS